MEDALRAHCRFYEQGYSGVLILIVVEDALREIKKYRKNRKIISLNPYCSGRCSPSIPSVALKSFLKVLILVVVEDALRGSQG